MSDVVFTRHAEWKMKYYRLSKQKVLSVIRRPDRVEEGIAAQTVAVMQAVSPNPPTGGGGGAKKWKQEIWVMYQSRRHVGTISKSQFPNSKQIQNSKFHPPAGGLNSANQQIRIISAWRYPGMSPKNKPIPEEILREIEALSEKVW